MRVAQVVAPRMQIVDLRHPSIEQGDTRAVIRQLRVRVPMDVVVVGKAEEELDRSGKRSSLDACRKVLYFAKSEFADRSSCPIRRSVRVGSGKALR